MAVRNILCAYSGESAKGSGLRHAIRLAKHHDAWLTGVLRHGRPVISKRFSHQIPQELIDFVDQKDAELVDAVSARFTEEAAAAGLTEQAEFVDLDPGSRTPLSEFARSFDLIVTGHHVYEPTEEHLVANPDLVALRSGRPVLVVPDSYDAEGLAERAIVAWDGKRASARAIGDAMEVLMEKGEVTLLSVGSAFPDGTDRMRLNLERHGVAVRTELRPRNGSIAQTIVDAAMERDARLIVTGAFEHSKFTHSILGGVTTEIQNLSTVPVFMSH